MLLAVTAANIYVAVFKLNVTAELPLNVPLLEVNPVPAVNALATALALVALSASTARLT